MYGAESIYGRRSMTILLSFSSIFNLCKVQQNINNMINNNIVRYSITQTNRQFNICVYLND